MRYERMHVYRDVLSLYAARAFTLQAHDPSSRQSYGSPTPGYLSEPPTVPGLCCLPLAR